MKGFIEVLVNGLTLDEKTPTLIEVKAIAFVKEYGRHSVLIQVKGNRMAYIVDETYEEIKQKIKEATEPRLMIDEKGNFKEVE